MGKTVYYSYSNQNDRHDLVNDYRWCGGRCTDWTMHSINAYQEWQGNIKVYFEWRRCHSCGAETTWKEITDRETGKRIFINTETKYRDRPIKEYDDFRRNANREYRTKYKNREYYDDEE